MNLNYFRRLQKNRTTQGIAADDVLREVPIIVRTSDEDMAVAIRYTTSAGSNQKLFDARFVRLGKLYGLNSEVPVPQQSLRISVVRDGENFTVQFENLPFGWANEFGSKSVFASSRAANAYALAALNRLLGTPDRYTKGARKNTGTLIWAVVLAFLFGGLLFSKGESKAVPPQTSTLNGIEAYRAGKSVENGELHLSAEQLQDLRSIASRAGFPLRPVNPNGTPFYVFADPACPHCKNLEVELDKMDASWNPVIIPVGILGDDSMRSVSIIQSAPSLEVAADYWKSAISGDILPDPASYAGTQKARVTQAFYTLLGLRGTPTIISADGRVIAQEISSSDLAQWLRKSAQ